MVITVMVLSVMLALACGRELFLMMTVCGVLFAPGAILFLWFDGYFDQSQHSVNSLGFDGSVFFSIPMTLIVLAALTHVRRAAFKKHATQ